MIMSGTVYPLRGEGDRAESDALRVVTPPPWSAVHPVGSPVAAGDRPLHLVPAEPAAEPALPGAYVGAPAPAASGGVADEVALLRRELELAVELLAEVPGMDERLQALLDRRASEVVVLAGQAADTAEVLGDVPGVREELSAHTAGLGAEARLDGRAAVTLLSKVRVTADRPPTWRLEARLLARVADRLREAGLTRDAGGEGADGTAEGLRAGEDYSVGDTVEFIPSEELRGIVPGPRRPGVWEVQVAAADLVEAVDPPFFRELAESATECSLFGPIAAGLVQPGAGGPDRWAEVAADPWADNELTRELRTLVIDDAAAGVESEAEQEPVEGEHLGDEAGEPDTGADTDVGTGADDQVDVDAADEPATSGDAVAEVDSTADKATDGGKAPRRRRPATRRGKAAPATAAASDAGDDEAEPEPVATEVQR